MDPKIREQVVDFLRDWLPGPAQALYREMMLRDPEGWSRDPHFDGGVIVEHALRGNGITEQVLGVRSLDAIWPELLERAVLGRPLGAGADGSDRERFAG